MAAAATCLSDIVLRFLRISLYEDDVGSDEACRTPGWLLTQSAKSDLSDEAPDD
jgi:hypothetical protein